MEPVSDTVKYLVQDAGSLRVLRGLEQLDTSLKHVADLSDVLLGGSVLRQNYADDGHLSADLRLSIELPWESVRLRPYVTLTDGVVSARCDLGVVVPQRPKDNLHLRPRTFEVQCVDLLTRMRREIEVAYSFAVGANVLTEVRNIIASQNLPAPLFAGEASAKTLAYALSFPIVDNEPVPTYLGVANALLAAVGYRGLYMDGRGTPRSEPYQSPATRPSEWLFDAQADNRITDPRVEREIEASDPVNVWIARQRGNITQAEGNGKYTRLDDSGGRTSLQTIGRNARTRFFDAVDQAALVVQGDRATESDRRTSTVYRVSTSPFPIAGHFDVYTYRDARLGPGDVRVLARSWRVDLGFGNSEHVWEAVV